MFSLRGLHPDVRAAAEFAHNVAARLGFNPRVTSTRRSWQQQAELRRNYEMCVNSGRFPSAPDCLYPANLPGDSAHNYGLAWDSVVDPADQQVWDAIREWIGFNVPDHDEIHAEVPDWRLYVR